MNRSELLRLKAELLCAGIQIDKNAMAALKDKNRYVVEKGFIHAAYFTIDDTVINTCVSEKLCNASPFSIHYCGDQFELRKDDGSDDLSCSKLWTLSSNSF